MKIKQGGQLKMEQNFTPVDRYKGEFINKLDSNVNLWT